MYSGQLNTESHPFEQAHIQLYRFSSLHVSHPVLLFVDETHFLLDGGLINCIEYLIGWLVT